MLDTEEILPISEHFFRNSEFLKTMMMDLTDHEELTILPISTEICDTDLMKRFLAIWDQPQFISNKSTMIDTVEEIVDYINLAQFFQMDVTKKRLFKQLKHVFNDCLACDDNGLSLLFQSNKQNLFPNLLKQTKILDNFLKQQPK